MSIDAVVLFFVFGALIQLLKVNVEFPPGLSRTLMLILLIAIGLKGGVALQSHANTTLLIQVLSVTSLGIVIPLICFPILRYFGGFNRINSANIAAHYGSVSVGTFAVALAVLQSRGIPYEGYFSLFVVVLEIPAIAIGILLAQHGDPLPGGPNHKINTYQILHEMFLNPGVCLLLVGLSIGYFANDSLDKIMPLFGDLFPGVLALFLLDMGMIAARRIKDISHNGLFLMSFAIAMPLVGGVLGASVGFYILGLSVGGTALLAVLSASASYIAVPAAMRQALPTANHSLSIAASLGVSFPFNVLVGIPLYIVLAQWLHGSIN